MYLIYGARNSKSKNGMKKNIQAKKRMNKNLLKSSKKERERCVCVMVVERSLFSLLKIFSLRMKKITFYLGFLSDGDIAAVVLCTDLMK
jgi:hypothetical protein